MALTFNPLVKKGFDETGSGGGVTDHGDLTGLSNDDHTQYLLADGSRAVSGDLTVNGGVVINELGNDEDTRIEGDTATNLLFIDASADAVQVGTTTAGAIADFKPMGIVLNEDGADRDIRMEGDSDDNTFFLDASSNRIGIGNASPSSKLHVGPASSNSMIQTTSITNAFTGGNTIAFVGENAASSSSVAGAGMGLYSNDAAALASGDRLGFLLFGGSSSASNVRNTAALTSFTTQAWSDGAAYGSNIRIETTPNGSTTRSQGIEFTQAGGMTVNEQGRDADTRIEGDTDQNLIFVDASTDRVGLGTATPNNKLDVVGTVQADGLRLDLTPTAETIVPTHTITISINGTNYKIPLVAA